MLERLPANNALSAALTEPDSSVRLQDLDQLTWAVVMDFEDEKEDGFITKRKGLTTITGQRHINGKWLRPKVQLKLSWEFMFDPVDPRYSLVANFTEDSSHKVIDLVGNVVTHLNTQHLIGLRNALRKNPVAAPKTEHPPRRRSAMTTPKFIKFQGERYRLAEAEEVTAAKRKKKGKRGRKSKRTTEPSVKKTDRFDDRFYNGDGVEFDIVILTKDRTGDRLPAGSKKVGRAIPEEIAVKLNPAQTVEANKAKEKGLLWFLIMDKVGWSWREKGATAGVENVQKALDYIEKQKNAENPSVIYSSRLVKSIGFSSR